jgi:hypothetical protein
VRRRSAAATLVSLVAAFAPAPAASADEVTAAELADLARRVDEPGVRARLERVDRVDGRPVAVGDALRGARGRELAERARTLAVSAGELGAARPNAAAARRDAREILDQRRFHEAQIPRPFEGILRWLGDRLQPVVDVLERAVPGGPNSAWALLAVLVLGLTGILTQRSIRRRAGAAAQARAREARLRAEDPRELELQAERAEREASWEDAVRLRFRAGLLRLDRAGVLRYRSSLTTGEIAALVDSAAFDDVGSAFDAIVYGGRPARREDAEDARSGWARVLAEAA